MTTTITRRKILGAALVAAPAALFAHEPEKNPAGTPSFDKETDVLVAGGGIAGCMAAVEAARAGRRVLLVQKLAMLGGNTALSTGWIRSSSTFWHKARGIEDDPKAYARDIIEYGRGCRDEAKALVIARRSSQLVDFLASAGVEFMDEEDRYNGGEKLRVVKVKGRGAALMAKLARAVESTPGITVMKSTSISRVLVEERTNSVTGAVLKTRSGSEVTVRARAVVLATGGFGRAQEMIERFTNPWAQTARTMDIGCRGDGLSIATELGAGSLNLNIAMVCPTFETTTETFYSAAPLSKGAVIVNEKGRRFTNECVIYTQTNIDMLKQKACWEILSGETHPLVAAMIEKGVARKCETFEELARLIGCPAEGLRADIEAHNARTLEGGTRPDAFGRTVFEKTLEAPFYAVSIKPVMLETVGGITIDEKSRVTTLFGRPVAQGLYAAGALAFGEHFGVGYRSGDAICYAGTTGMTAGREAALL